MQAPLSTPVYYVLFHDNLAPPLFRIEGKLQTTCLCAACTCQHVNVHRPGPACAPPMHNPIPPPPPPHGLVPPMQATTPKALCLHIRTPPPCRKSMERRTCPIAPIPQPCKSAACSAEIEAVLAPSRVAVFDAATRSIGPPVPGERLTKHANACEGTTPQTMHQQACMCSWREAKNFERHGEKLLASSSCSANRPLAPQQASFKLW